MFRGKGDFEVGKSWIQILAAELRGGGKREKKKKRNGERGERMRRVPSSNLGFTKSRHGGDKEIIGSR